MCSNSVKQNDKPAKDNTDSMLFDIAVGEEFILTGLIMWIFMLLHHVGDTFYVGII